MTPAWTMTGFADEISPDLGEQVALLAELGIRHIELRSVQLTKILDLTDAELRRIRDALDAAGIALSCVGSDLGKIRITDPFAPHLERTRRAVEVARFFATPRIRVFSFFIPAGENPARHRDEVIARTRAMVEVARDGGATLLHENEKEIYGDVPGRVADLLAAVDSPSYRAVFDPANYVQCGVRPMDEAWPLVHRYTDYIHCKDARFPVDADDIGEVTPLRRGRRPVARAHRGPQGLRLRGLPLPRAAPGPLRRLRRPVRPRELHARPRRPPDAPGPGRRRDGLRRP